MKSKIFKPLLVLVGIFVVCLSLFFGRITAKASTNDDYETVYQTVFSEYQIDDYNAQRVDVVDPLCESVNVDEGGSFVLNYLGEYKVFEADKLTTKIVVSAKSPENQIESMFSGNNIVLVDSDKDWSDVNTYARKGIEIASSGSSSYFYYDNIVDLNTLDIDDVLFSCFVENSERSSFKQMKISLIDVHDENNVLSFTYKKSNDISATVSYINTYLTVQFNGYSLALSLESGKDGLRELGAAIMRTDFSLDPRVTEPMGIRYDVSTNEVYNYMGTKMVIDLDDENMLKGREPFAGFTDNKVYLKVEVDGTQSCLLIQDLVGCQTDDLTNFDFGYDGVLKLGYDGAYVIGNVLNVGKINVPYTLPVADCSFMFDDSVVCDYKLRFYDNGWKDITDAVSAGSFTPTKAGYYSIKYTLNGSLIGDLEKVVYFEVADEIAEIQILGEDSEQDLFTYYKVQDFAATGGSGRYKFEVSYSYNGKEVVPNVNGEIYLNEKGALNVNVSLTDFLGATASTTFTVAVRPISVVDVYYVPVSCFSGQALEFSDFSAINYRFNKNEDGYYMNKTVRVNGEMLAEDWMYTPQRGAGTITVEFIGGLDTEYQTSKSYVIPVIDLAEEFNPLDYFITNDVAMETIDVGTLCTFSKDSSFQISTLVSAEKISLSFSLIEGWYNARFDNIIIVLEDYKDPEKTFTATFSRFRGYDLSDKISTASQILLTCNESDSLGYSYTIMTYDDSAYFAGTKYYKIEFNFNGYEKTLTNSSGGVVYFVKKFDNGKFFDGFTDGLVKLTVKFGAIKNQSESKVVFNSITNQNLTSYALEEGDLQGPQISLCDKIVTPKFGETLVIPKAVAYDFFCGKSTFIKSKLVKPDGTSINLDANKATSITCDQYGVYSIEYSAEDANGNISKRSYTVKVEDKESPNIVLGANKSEYKVGQSLSGVVYTARDNVKIKSEQIFVRDFNGKMILVSDGYVFAEKGRYEIYVRVTDANGNSHYESFIVTVVDGDKK